MILSYRLFLLLEADLLLLYSELLGDFFLKRLDRLQKL